MKESMKRIIAVLMAAMLLAGALAACGSTPDASEASTAGADTGASSAEGDLNPGTSMTIRADKSIVTCADWPAYIDPGVGSKRTDSVAFVNLYDTLVFPESDGSITPLVAESWDVNDTSTEYVFHLRDDVVFHSGNPLTANDVKFSMDRLMTMGEGYAYMFADLLQGTEVVDDHTVKFTLSSSSGTFPAMIIRLYILDEKTVMENIDPAGSYGEFGDYGKAWLMTNDAGSGPYKIKEVRTEEFVLMERYEEHWLGWEEGAPQEVKLLGGVESSTMRTMMSRGELDFSDDAQTPESLDAMADMEGVDVVRSQVGLNFNMSLNTKVAPTDDVHVRKAMAFAFDYQSAIDNIYLGSVKPTGPVVQGLTGAALTEAEMPYHYDLEMAMAELEQSPYYDELMSGSMKIDLTWCTEGGDQQEKLALLMQAGLQAIGVKLNVTGKPFATMMTDAQTVETTPNVSFVLFAPPYLDGGGYLKARYHSSSTGSWEQMEWLQDAEIDAMIDEAMTIADEDTRNAMYREIALKVVDLCPTIWVADFASSHGYRSGYVTGWPLAEKYKAGEPAVYATGYTEYYRDFKVA